MLDSLSCQLALRNRALSLTVCTTGSTSLSATTTGYARTAGSFVTDGFVIGQEITPTGFATNTVDVVKAVTALTLDTVTARAAEVAAGSRTIAVKLPALRAWENVDFTATTGRPYIEEDFAPGTHRIITAPMQGARAEQDGLYMLKLYGLSNVGISALRKTADAILALYTPGTVLTSGSTSVYVRGDPAPVAAQILPQGNGWSVLPLSIYWRARSVNTIAA